jgi:hypothetical protein
MTTVLDILRNLLDDEAAHAVEHCLDTKLAAVEDKVKIAMSAPAAAPDHNFPISLSNSDTSQATPSLGVLETLLVSSAGYEPFLMEAGFGTLMARALAKIIVHRARRIAEESQRRGEVFDTLRFLARRDRQPRAVLRCARLLVEAWDKSSIVETVFDEAGYNESEFIGLLRATVARQPVSYDRIMQIAALLVPYLSLKRGPAMTAASIAHEHCLSLPQIAQHLKRRPPRHPAETSGIC